VKEEKGKCKFVFISSFLLNLRVEQACHTHITKLSNTKALGSDLRGERRQAAGSR
jgi:hypothetical protein